MLDSSCQCNKEAWGSFVRAAILPEQQGKEFGMPHRQAGVMSGHIKAGTSTNSKKIAGCVGGVASENDFFFLHVQAARQPCLINLNRSGELKCHL